MLTIRTAAQIRGAPHLRGFRSCAASTGVPLRPADLARVARAEAGLWQRELRRRWLARLWTAHKPRAASSGRL